MKKIFLLVCIIATIFSCKIIEVFHPSNPESNIVSCWKLVELLDYPGNDSGTYQPVISEKQLIFRKDGIVKSNFMFCCLGDASNLKTDSYAKYDDTKKTINFYYSYNKKRKQVALHYYYLNDSILELDHPCEEGCGEKYLKIKQK